MTKQELIKTCRYYLMSGFFSSKVGDSCIEFIDLLEELDEPQKVKVPQFVADWIEACKENSAIGLYIAMNPDFLKQFNKNEELISWVRKINNQNLFARAWLDGYEVEEEKRYLVKMKGVSDSYCVLTFYEDPDRWIMGTTSNYHNATKCHTRKELEEAGFSWVFDCEGIEIEEIEQ